MTQRLNQAQLDTLAAYLDGTLSADQRTAFEASVSRDPALKAELDFQRRLDGSLSRLFDHDGQTEEAPAVAGTISPATATPRRRYRWFAAAAAFLLTATLTVYFLSAPTDPNLMSPDQLYAKMERINWVP